MKSPTTNKKVFINTITQFLGKMLTITASFFIVKIVAEFGADFYGNYVTSYEFLAFFGIIADAGLFTIAVREMSKNPQKTAFILGNIFSMRLLLIIFVTILAGISAQFIPSYSPLVKTGIWITGVSMALTIIAGTLSSVLQSRMKIHYFSGSLVLGKIILAILIYSLTKFYTTTKSPEKIFILMLISGVIANFIFALSTFYFTQKEVKISLKFDFNWWKKTLKTSIPYGVSLILQTLYLRADLVIISIILGATAVGIYGISARILESFLILGVFFGQAILPKLSAEEKNLQKYQQTLIWGLEKCLIFAFPLITGTYLFAPEIITLLSNSSYLSPENSIGADKILLILIPTILFAYLNQLFSFGLVSKNKQNYLLIVNSIALFLNISLNLLFLKPYGIITAAISTLFCEFIVFILLTHKTFKKLNPKFNYFNIFIIITSNLSIFTLIFLTPLAQNLMLSVAVYSLIYGSLLFLFRNNLFKTK